MKTKLLNWQFVIIRKLDTLVVGNLLEVILCLLHERDGHLNTFIFPWTIL